MLARSDRFYDRIRVHNGIASFDKNLRRKRHHDRSRIPNYLCYLILMDSTAILVFAIVAIIVQRFFFFQAALNRICICTTRFPNLDRFLQ